jgi:DNA ligase-1
MLDQNRQDALDGELYLHGVPFQKLSSMVKLSDEGLEYHVYDLATDRPLGFAERYAEVHDMFKKCLNLKCLKCKLVECTFARNLKDVKAALKRYVKAGYEGVMIRDMNTPYEGGKRSASLLKYKKFTTDEFRVVDVLEATGKDKGTPVFEFGNFRARPVGTLEERRDMFRHKEDYIGKMMTVKFQGVSQAGVPRFPVALAIRDYE